MPRLTLEKTLATFREMEGFVPYQFYCAVGPPWNGGKVRKNPFVVPSFHYSEDAAWSEVAVYSASVTPWHRDVVRALKRAGYGDAKLSKFLDWQSRPTTVTTSKRRLYGKREYVGELAFLKSVGTKASPSQWLIRTRASRTGHEPRRTQGTWLTAIEVARDSELPWNDWALCFHRKGHLPRAKGAPNVGVVATTMAIADPIEHIAETYVGFHDLDEPARPLPPAILRPLRRELRAAGYRIVKAVDFLCAIKRVGSAAAAAREAERAFAQFTASPSPTSSPQAR
jgi:hypothetical protein